MIEVNLLYKLKGHRGAIYKIIQGENIGNIISAGGDGWMVSWTPNLSTDGNLIAKDEDNIFTLLKPDEHTLLAGTLQGNLLHIDLKSAKPRKIVHHRKGLYDLVLQDQTLWTLGGDGNLSKWQSTTLLPTDTYRISDKALRKMAFHPRRPIAAIASSNGSIYLFDLETDRIFHQIDQAHNGAVFCLQFSPDGRTLYSGGLDATLRSWDTDQWNIGEDIPAHWFTINDMAIHPQGHLLATGSRDKDIKLWSLPELKLLKVIDYARFQSHQHSVNTLLWSPDGTRLYSGSDDRSVCVFGLGVG